MNIRGLKPDEIEVRVGSVSEKGASLLLYKNARTDMAILDETFGAENWQRDHKEVKGNLFCGIGIKATAINPEASHTEWIWKWDCGTESFTEKEKGEASDSFKRAGFNVGIGRELYTAPRIFVSCPTREKPNTNGKVHELKDRFQFYGAYVKDIEYEEKDGTRTISKVVICDQDGNKIYPTKGTAKKTKKESTEEVKEEVKEEIKEEVKKEVKEQPQENVPQATMKELQNLKDTCTKMGFDYKEVWRATGDPKDLSIDHLKKAYAWTRENRDEIG